MNIYNKTNIFIIPLIILFFLFCIPSVTFALTNTPTPSPSPTASSTPSLAPTEAPNGTTSGSESVEDKKGSTGSMDLLLYGIFSVVYLMVIHFALAIKNEFNLWLMGTYFVIGGVVGWLIGSYEGGFALAVVLSLIFW